MCCMYTVYSGMQEWVIQIPSIPILVSVLFPSLHLRIKFLLLVISIATDSPFENEKDRQNQQEINYPRMSLISNCSEWSVFSCMVTYVKHHK